MRKYILLAVFLSASVTVAAQPQTKTEPYDELKFGRGATKTTTLSTDERLNKVVTIEVKDNRGVLKERTVWKKDLENKWTVERETLKPSGKLDCKTTVKFDKDNKMKEVEITFDNKKPIVYTRDKNQMVSKDGEKWFSEQIEELDELFQKDIKKIEENTIPSLESKSISCNTSNGICRPKVELFVGYSSLRGDYGIGKESFPAGVRVAAVYNLTNHIAVGIDASFNSRKIGTENLSRSFIMAEGKYVLGNMDDCDRKLFGNIRILGGIGIEKYGSSSGSGPAFGGGAGVIHLITKKVAARVQVDHLSVKYEGAEKLNNNLRLSGGLLLRLGD